MSSARQERAPETSRRRPSLREPIVVAQFWRNRRGEAVRVQLSEFESKTIVDIRMWFTAPDGTLKPSAKGLSCVVLRLPELAAALVKAERKARELGLLEEADA
jgi:hypothetical protein